MTTGEGISRQIMIEVFFVQRRDVIASSKMFAMTIVALIVFCYTSMIALRCPYPTRNVLVAVCTLTVWDAAEAHVAAIALVLSIEMCMHR